VRSTGETGDVVLASDRWIAEEADGLTTAEYKELPVRYDEVEAMTPEVLVHDERKPAATFPDLTARAISSSTLSMSRLNSS